MQLENSFTVPATPDVAWGVLLDVDRVAPCMPGATLTEHDGDNFGGTVKVKVGPIALTYKGTAAFVDKDETTRTVKIDAKARETKGSGTANAKISCQLTPDGDGTRVDVTTDLAITGRPAQFGRGVIGEVAGKVITQFAAALAEEISAGPGTPAAEPEAAASAEPPAEAAEPPAPVQESAAEIAAEASAPQASVVPEAIATPAPPAPRRSAEAIDLLDVAGAPVAKRLIPVGAGALLLLLVFVILRRRR